MPRGYRTLQLSFAGGEMSPEMFSRYDDARFRSGAALMRNMIAHPRGSVQRRPGFGLVLETKDSAFRSRLLPFRFSTDQTTAIEMGRATIDTEERGYFRFHIDGGTLLQTKPPEYRSTETTDDVFENSTGTFNIGTERFTWIGHTLAEGEPVFFTTTGTLPPELTERTVYYVKSPIADEFGLSLSPGGSLINLTGAGSGTITAYSCRWDLSQTLTGPTSHGFETGDPIVFTINKTGSTFTVAFDIATNLVTRTNHGYINGDTVVFSSSTADLPEPLEEEKFYYIRDRTTNTFAVSDVRAGPPIDLTDPGSGTFTHAVLPRAFAYSTNAPVFTEPNRTYYAIKIDENLIQIAETRADALAGRPLGYVGWGTADDATIAVHYDYRQGATVYDGSRVNALDAPYYLFRSASWGEPGSRYIRTADHIGHEPLSPTAPVGPPNRVGPQQYWQQMPGSSATIGWNTGASRVTWTLHGLSDGDVVTFSATVNLPPGINEGQAYYVRNKQDNDFQIAADPVTLTTETIVVGWSGIQTAFANGYYEVPHSYPEDDLFEVNTAQSADVLTMAHVDRPAAELRRRGATDWILEDVAFNTEVATPANVIATGFAGEGQIPVSVTTASPGSVNFTADPLFGPGERVQLFNIETAAGVEYIPDGIYVVEDTVGTAPYSVSLKEFENGAQVNVTVAFTDMSATARVRSSNPFADTDETYAVTALDDNNEESQASESVTISNNLLVSGAYNTITWDAVTGARRYRVYKDVNGLLGFIGETDVPTTTFLDDNIGPDLSFTPPILDGGLRLEFEPTFSPSPENLVEIPAHGLVAGAPVIFETNDTLPAGIEFLRTYYVLDPKDDSFQLSATPTGTTAVTFTDTGSGQTTMLAGAFPGAVCYFEQRRVFGGARSFPQDFWMTASSTESDLSYSIPSLDSDRIKNRLAARERSQIRHALPVGNLIMLTSAAEYRLTSLDGGPLTPGSVSARAPTQVGVSLVAPVVVNNSVLFPEDRGGHLREMGYVDRVGDYVTGDVSLRAAHLFDNRTLREMGYHQAPHPVVWAVSSTGSLLGLTYIPEEQLAGWHQHDIDGTIESIAVIPEGLEDRLYIIANRGGTRYVERMGCQCIDAIEDLFYVDSGATYSGTATTSLFIPHLASQSVVYLADGIVGSGTVDATGIFTLTTAASTIHVGLPYESDLQTIPLGMQVDAAVGVGRTKNINHVYIRVRDSGPFQVGPDENSLRVTNDPVAGALLTALEQKLIPGNWNLEGQVLIRSSAPLSLVVAGVTLEVATGG